MANTGGDDLVAARRFMNLCRLHMSDMFSGGQLPMTDVVSRLTEIQDHAKIMHARSIYKSAQSVIKNLSGHKPPVDCTSSVLVLQKLIQQYDKGLSEIAPPTQRRAKPVKSNPVGADVLSDLTRQIETAKTLAPLIKFADKDDRKGLIKLVSLAANHSKKPAQKQSENVKVILPSLTNNWLREARTQGKSISVSSSIDDALIKKDILNAVQSNLRALGNVLIARSIETPDQLEAQGLSRSAHLAITGRLSRGTMKLLLSCKGQQISDEHLNPISERIRAAGLTPYLDFKGDLIRFEIRDIPAHRVSAAEEREVAS